MRPNPSFARCFQGLSRAIPRVQSQLIRPFSYRLLTTATCNNILPHLHRGAFARVPLQTIQTPVKRHYSSLSIDTPALEYDFNDVKKISDVKSHQGITLVDVREPAEYSNGHIPSAINIPYNSSPGALGLDPEEFHEEFGFDKPSTDDMLVFYCLGGVRSTAAEGIAATYGYQNRANYVGSWQDWMAKNGEQEA